MAPLNLGRSSDARARIAALWVERLTTGEASAAEIAEFKAWLTADPENRAAYDTARAIYAELGQSKLRNRRPVLRIAGGGALAASVAAAIFFTVNAADHATATGEISEFALADGTRVWLDSDSAIDVAIDGERRTITLKQGRAAFAVADDARPFAVKAGDATVTDIGTEFAVDRTNALTVEVDEGLVEVAHQNQHIRLKAGERGQFEGTAAIKSALGPDRLAWRERRITLDRTTLAEALGTLDRYYSGRIVLMDSGLGTAKVSGQLQSDRVDDGLDSLARSQHLTVTRLPWLRLIRSAGSENR